MDFVEWFLTSKLNSHVCRGKARPPLGTGVDLRPWASVSHWQRAQPLGSRILGRVRFLGEEDGLLPHEILPRGFPETYLRGKAPMANGMATCPTSISKTTACIEIHGGGASPWVSYPQLSILQDDSYLP